MKTKTLGAPTVTEASMISPVADHLMIGGASIIAFFLYWIFVDPINAKTGVISAAFYLSFAVNSPHFLSSYQLLYGDNRALITKKFSFFWAAIIAPALIIGILAFGAMTANTHLLGLLAQGMYLSVGWHYVKQIFGTAIVASAVQKRYFSVTERNFILLNLYSLWGVSWLNSNLKKTTNGLDGLNFSSLSLPESYLSFAYYAVAITLAASLYVCIRKYIQTGVRPATSAMLSFAAIYFWFIPSFYHSAYSVMIPFFHSLQYLLFVISMKKNQALSLAEKQRTPLTQRGTYVRTLLGFSALAVVLGALTFEFVPKGLDRYFPFQTAALGPTFWLFSISVFVNIHHYFIDNVIWRGDNEMLKEHIVGASQKAAA